MSNSSARLDETVTPILATIGNLLTTTVGDTKYVSLKGYAGCQIIIAIGDGTTVTGSTITLKQATAVAGTGEKALAFTRMLKNVDYAATQTLAETVVTASSFTTPTVDSKDQVYVIDVNATTLDQSLGFDCIRVDGTGHASTSPRGCVVLYNLYGPRFSGITPLTD